MAAVAYRASSSTLSLDGWTAGGAPADAAADDSADELLRLLDAEFGTEDAPAHGHERAPAPAPPGPARRRGRGRDASAPPRRDASAPPQPRPRGGGVKRRRASSPVAGGKLAAQRKVARPRPGTQLASLRDAWRTDAFDACVRVIDRERAAYEAAMKRKSTELGKELNRNLSPATESTITYIASFTPDAPSAALGDELWDRALASDAWRAFNTEAYPIGDAPRRGAKFCGQTLALAHGVGGANRVSIKFSTNNLHITGCITTADVAKAIEYGLRVLAFMAAEAAAAAEARRCTGLWTPLINTNTHLYTPVHMTNTQRILTEHGSAFGSSMDVPTNFQEHAALRVSFIPPDAADADADADAANAARPGHSAAAKHDNRRAHIKLFQKGSLVVSAPSFWALQHTYTTLYNLLMLNAEQVRADAEAEAEADAEAEAETI